MVLTSTKKRRSVIGGAKMLRTDLIATMALTLLSGGTSAIAQNQGAGACCAPGHHGHQRACDPVSGRHSERCSLNLLAKRSAGGIAMATVAIAWRPVAAYTYISKNMEGKLCG